MKKQVVQLGHDLRCTIQCKKAIRDMLCMQMSDIQSSSWTGLNN